MNAPAAGLDLRAIGIGAATGIGASVVMSLLWVLLPTQNMAAHIGIVLIVSHVIGAVIDIATGFVAGWLARQRGAVHGFFAGLIANIVSLAIGYGITLVRTDYGRTVDQVFAYLVSMLPWQIVGVVLATIAGALAVRLAPR
jgi:hypothetical protein